MCGGVGLSLEQLIRPAPHVFLITPDNDNNLPHQTTAISFAAAGNLRIETVGGEVVTIPSGALAAGVQHAIQIRKVFATGTAATGLVGYW